MSNIQRSIIVCRICDKYKSQDTARGFEGYYIGSSLTYPPNEVLKYISSSGHSSWNFTIAQEKKKLTIGNRSMINVEYFKDEHGMKWKTILVVRHKYNVLLEFYYVPDSIEL